MMPGEPVDVGVCNTGGGVAPWQATINIIRVTRISWVVLIGCIRSGIFLLNWTVELYT
jgi:hypothetical protein